MKLTDRRVLLAIGLGAAAGVAYLATRSAGPVKLAQFTEQCEGTLQEHLITREELGETAALMPHRYPARIAPGLSSLITHGFAPLYQLPDPQVAALPAELN